MDYLEDERKKKKSTRSREKRKASDDKIEQLKNKNRCLEKDVDAVTSSVDEYAEKAEKPTNLLGCRSQTAYIGQPNRKPQN